MEGTWRTTGPEAALPWANPAETRSGTAWLAAACAVVGGLTALRLFVLWHAGLELDFEEGQYWLWAQTPAWGYWSKPPMVAWLIAATTEVCGDAEPCVRLASPLIHAATAATLGALGHRLGGPRLGFWSAVTYATLPGVALSAVLLTTDVPLLCCWAVALLAFVRLLDGGRWPWAAVCGVALGAGVLGKYSMLLFVPCAGLYLMASGARLRLAHVALAAGVAALLIAPKVAWNLENHLGTVRHSLSRLRPGVSSFQLDEPLLFLLAQVAVIGPVLAWTLLSRLRTRTGGDGDRLRLLGWFTFPPLALAVAASIVARANANWAAPAWVAGCVLAAASLLETGRSRSLLSSLTLNTIVGLVLYGALATVPAIRLPGIAPLPVAARFHGWEILGRHAAAQAAHLGQARILVELRELLAVAAYYGRVPEERLVEWNPSGVPRSHFQYRTRIAAGDPGPFLFVSYRPRPAGVTRRFEHAERIDVVTVALAPGLTRTHWLYLLSGFRGYPVPRRRRAGLAARPAGVAPAAASR